MIRYEFFYFKTFCSLKSTFFKKTDINLEKRHKVYFDFNEIAYTGVPFIIIGSEKMFCAHGKDFNKSHKEKRKLEKVNEVSI